MSHKFNEKIIIKGAREHNLKNISLEIPRNSFVVITGLSGSGKSSLAFDTIYAEGQRRYVESLSAYARQFLGLMEKPDVDFIDGLSPAISIEQKTSHRNPRSTVGTVTEIYDYLRLLFARIGVPYCPECGEMIVSMSVDQIVENIMTLPLKTKLQIMAPVIRGKKGEHKDIFEKAEKNGFTRFRVDGIVCTIDEIPVLKKNIKHTIEIVIDRLIMKDGIRPRLADSVETALDISDGLMTILVNDEEKLYSSKHACKQCGYVLQELSPRMFSFNSPYGACEECSGLGFHMMFNKDFIVPDENISIEKGAVRVWGKQWNLEQAEYLNRNFNIDTKIPWKDLDDKTKKFLWYGNGIRQSKLLPDSKNFEGIIPNMERRYKETASEDIRKWMEGFMINKVCPSCSGKRLKKESLSVKVSNKHINEITEMSILDACKYFKNIELNETQRKISEQVLKEINQRLGFLKNVGLEYLTLDRSAGTLSGGEAQRIRLATQIGASLTGVLYILDEPSIGLHQRDNRMLLETLKHLRDIGNTVIVVEHDEETMTEADYIVDLGPGAGTEGGEIVGIGGIEDIKNSKISITGKFLNRERFIDIPVQRRKSEQYINIIGATENNLKNINVNIPLGVFSAVTGVSGSGKSTLIMEILYKALANLVMKSKQYPGAFKKIEGIENIDKVIDIDQSPIGRTPRSNPATYTGIFTPIRELFTNTPEAKIRGYKAGRFSFNVAGGRCEACNGDGINKIEMHFLPDVFVTCDVCNGKRYNHETLEIRYKGKNIFEVLEMTVNEAADFFKNIPTVSRRLETLKEVGLGYIKLGQPATTLSGGEAQRIKLSTELSKRSTGKTLYILDEPTTGLHFADIEKLLKVLQKLVDKGNSVAVIEHNLDVIKTADYIVDLGPEGGDNGGTVVACGTPEEVAGIDKSHTGKFLKEILFP